jgi:glucose 1-dehydrogenase
MNVKSFAVFPHRKELALREEEEPLVTAPLQLKVRVREVGLCGTDREIASFDYGEPPPGSEHLVLGHEGLGEVVETGSEVTGFNTGDLVVPMVRRPCASQHCHACRSGRQDFCYTGDFTERGIKKAHGFLTGYIVDDAAYFVRVPQELHDVAVLTEPLTIAEKALAQIAQIQQRLPWACPTDGAPPRCVCRAVVLGAGPIGILGAMALVDEGYETFVYSRDPIEAPRARLVESFGAHYVHSESVSFDTLAAKAGNIDVVYEATGAAQISFQLMEVLGTNGIYVLTGVPGRKGPVAINAPRLMRNLVLKNQVIFGTVNAGYADFVAAVRRLGVLLHRWPAPLRGLITGRHPIEDCRELLLGKPEGIKRVIRLD